MFSLVSGSFFSAFRPMARRLRTSSRLGCFSLTVQPMVPRQPSMSNVADPDIILGSAPCFLSCLPASGPTARPFSTALQGLNLSRPHSVMRVPFFPSDIVFASIPYTLLSSHPCAPWPRLHVFKVDCYWYTVGTYSFSSSHGCELLHTVVYLAMRRFGLITTRCGGIY